MIVEMTSLTPAPRANQVFGQWRVAIRLLPFCWRSLYMQHSFTRRWHYSMVALALLAALDMRIHVWGGTLRMEIGKQSGSDMNMK